MKTQMLLVALFFAALSNVNAQDCNADIEILEEDQVANRSPILIQKNESGYIGYAHVPNEYIELGSVNELIQFEGSAKIVFTEHLTFKSVKVINERIYLFTQEANLNGNKGHSEMAIYEYLKDENKLELIETSIKSTVDDGYAKYYVSVSQNENFIAVTKGFFGGKGLYNIESTVFNAQWEPLYQRNDAWEKKGIYDKNIWKQTLSNTGDLGILAIRHYSSAHQQKFSDYELLVYSEDQQEAYTFNVAVDGFKISDASFFIESEGDNINLFCWYAKGNSKNANGYLKMEIDAESHTEIRHTEHAVSLGMVTPTLEKGELDKAKKDEAKGKLKLHVYKEKNISAGDGSHLVLLERIVDISESDMNVSIYECEDILVLKFNAAGKLDWATNVPKYQNSRYGYNLSYKHLFLESNDLLLVYSNHSKNSDDDIYSTIITFDSGEKQTCALVNSTQKDFYFYSGYDCQLKDELVFFGSKRNHLSNLKKYNTNREELLDLWPAMVLPYK